MKILLLSGGSGKRLWPLSNDIRSKQFLKLLKNEKGDQESMVQRVYNQIKTSGINSDIVVATGRKQRDSVMSHLGDTVDLVLEPERRDTFPAIALASAYLYYEKDMRDDEVIVVLPVDPYADLEYFTLLKEIEKKIIYGETNICLMGIKPTYPSAKYGYIIPDSDTGFVKSFQEKPTEKLAKQLIDDGALWNGGVFAFKAGYIMDKLRQYIKFNNFPDIEEQYSSLPKISFDYEIVEKEASIAMVEYRGMWKDIGTWNTLTEVMDDYKNGNVLMSNSCENTHVINELDIPVTVLGAKNMVVVASPDGILVSDKYESSQLKEYVNDISKIPMYEEFGWGETKVLDYVEFDEGKYSITKNIIIIAGEYLNFEENSNKDVILTIVSGKGDIVIDNQIKGFKSGDVNIINKEQNYSIRALTNLRIIEVVIGSKTTEKKAIVFQ